jgi:glycosyltransferase involved in cell wall biosynthesis
VGGIISLDAVTAHMISIFILTKDEERNIADCIEAVRWSDDIHVLDSYSTDATVEIAKQLGAKVSLRKFDSYSGQQNWALENLPFKYPWVFYCDADERVTPALAQAMQRAADEPGDAAAFQIQRRDFFLGAWLKHVQVTSFYLRLFRPERMRYERVVNPISIVDGPVSQVGGYLDHFPFSKGIADWVAKHNSYSTMEAEQILAYRIAAGRAGSARWNLRSAIFAKDFTERRRNQKELFYRLPCRPLVKFLAIYFFKRGFLDGRAGLTYSILISFYEYMIVLKTRELADPEKNPRGTAEATRQTLHR